MINEARGFERNARGKEEAITLQDKEARIVEKRAPNTPVLKKFCNPFPTPNKFPSPDSIVVILAIKNMTMV